MRLLMQRLDGQGKVLETRYLPVDGFATNLQSKDVDGDGEADLIVFNASEEIIQWIYETYGRHRSALTAVVTRYRTRGAVAEVARRLA